MSLIWWGIVETNYFLDGAEATVTLSIGSDCVYIIATHTGSIQTIFDWACYFSWYSYTGRPTLYLCSNVWAVNSYILFCKNCSVKKLITVALILTSGRIEVVMYWYIIQFEVDKTLRVCHRDIFEVLLYWQLQVWHVCHAHTILCVWHACAV